ncbi:MAG: hypothetical protein J6L91_04995 [Clostridia bacterium]|nr:hypothetical protein [Clostridia bacterium]
MADVDYSDEVSQLNKKCFTDRLPDGGFYRFKESGDRLWVIADRLKVVKILTEKERRKILDDANYDEVESVKPYVRRLTKC